MGQGYIMVSREIFYTIIDNKDLLQLYFKLHLGAVFRQKWVPVTTGRGITDVKLERGQVLYGRKSWAKALDMAESTLQNRVNTLEKMGLISVKAVTHYSIVTICYYEGFVDDNSVEISTNNPNKEQPITSTKDNQQPELATHTNKEEVKRKKEKTNVDDFQSSTAVLKFDHDSTEMDLCRDMVKFLSKEVKYPGKGKTPDVILQKMQPWCKTFDHILRLDKRPLDLTKQLIEYAQRDDNNFVVLSPKSLREKFDNLQIAFNKNQNSAPINGGGYKTRSEKNEEFWENYYKERGLERNKSTLKIVN